MYGASSSHWTGSPGVERPWIARSRQCPSAAAASGLTAFPIWTQQDVCAFEIVHDRKSLHPTANLVSKLNNDKFFLHEVSADLCANLQALLSLPLPHRLALPFLQPVQPPMLWPVWLLNLHCNFQKCQDQGLLDWQIPCRSTCCVSCPCCKTEG